MKILDLGKHRRARVWIGDLPRAGYHSLKTVTFSVPAIGVKEDVLKLAAVEVVVPLGGRVMYGLLGGTFTASSTNRLDVDVCVASETGAPFYETLAHKGFDIRVGLPSEYIRGVGDGVALAKGELGRLAAGKLVIDHAAHGAAGSSEAVFKHLAVALIKLFNRTTIDEPSDAELVALFPFTFS